MIINRLASLQTIQNQIEQDPEQFSNHKDALLASAKQALSVAPTAVTDKKMTAHAPSNDPHDYVSIATYFWPNPDTKDGLPYIGRDGEISPDFALYDRQAWEKCAHVIATAARSAFLLKQQDLASQAAQRIKHWFLDPATYMKPHLKHAQFVPGLNTGRCYGIIDFALYLPLLLDSIQLLEEMDCPDWDDSDRQNMRNWCHELLQWLRADPLALEEESRHNNHGTFFDLLVIALANFLNQPLEFEQQLHFLNERTLSQINEEGLMIHEITRTCSFGYSQMALRGLIQQHWYAKTHQHQAANDPKAMEALCRAGDNFYAFCCSNDKWPYKQIEPVDWRVIAPLFSGLEAVSNKTYPLDALAHRFPANFNPELYAMEEPIHPFGVTRGVN